MNFALCVLEFVWERGREEETARFPSRREWREESRESLTSEKSKEKSWKWTGSIPFFSILARTKDDKSYDDILKIEISLHLFYLSNIWRIRQDRSLEKFRNISPYRNWLPIFLNGRRRSRNVGIKWNQIGSRTETIEPRQVSNPNKPNFRYVLILFINVTSTTRSYNNNVN